MKRIVDFLMKKIKKKMKKNILVSSILERIK